ncbi:MAG: winged helix-turn-helix domain-containing protein [Candidatus Omnitrophota bacterium]
MVIKIGIAAGDIWHYLDEHGPSKLSELSANIDKSRDLILMSLGWLAREGHVLLEEENDNFLVSLRKNE